MNDEATVFLVDDDPTALQALAILVKKVFTRVEAFSSPGDFLAACHDSHPGCLVSEVVMPGVSGFELHRQLMHDKIVLPVVFVTGHGNVPMAVEAMQLGAIDFLEKPVQAQRLWNSIRKALEFGQQSRQRLARRHQAEERLARLTPGEREVLHLILEGMMNKEMAAKLSLSTRTIEDRRAKLMRKMDVKSLVELVQLVMTH